MDYFIECKNIDLSLTFNCGQCFRWEYDTSRTAYVGFAGNKSATVKQHEDGIILSDVHETDLPFWEDYFCIGEDYSALIKRFSENPTLKAACEFAPGIRVLRQQPFEALISFIISQNNNIKRISGIIKRLCKNGVFLEPEELGKFSIDDLTACGAGYRAAYIADAVKKINNGEISLDEIAKMPYNVSRSELLKIKGVGDKVADCVLLFGFHKTEAFPRDVWIKRVLAQYYPDGLPDCVKGYEGIAQQFLFHYIRNCP